MSPNQMNPAQLGARRMVMGPTPKGRLGSETSRPIQGKPPIEVEAPPPPHMLEALAPCRFAGDPLRNP
jgi:hypothetical protein